jgi:predicted ATPase
MLTRLKITGFKNLVDVDVRFGPFTCIAGANGAGKSNLFDAIMFLSALADNPLIDAAKAVRDEGGRASDIRNLFHCVGENHAAKMTFEAEMIVPERGVDDLGQEAKAKITFLRYLLTIGFRSDSFSRSGGLELLYEELSHINLGTASQNILFPHKAAAWRYSAVKGRRSGGAFISTQGEGKERIIELHTDGDGGGRPRLILSANMPRTVLSTVNTAENPTALMAKREIQSWRQLRLEPGALRKPDELSAQTMLGADGSHLAATLYNLARMESSTESESAVSDSANLRQSRIYAGLSARLAEFMDDAREIAVDHDETRELLTVMLTKADGTQHPARSLSDGTLRFLAIALLELDRKSTGLFCLEEPENGINPDRIRMLTDILQEIAVDVCTPVGPDNPLRQVIINTHSPVVIAQVPDDSLLVAELSETMKDGLCFKSARFSCLPNTWRQTPQENIATIDRERLSSYRDPIQQQAPEQHIKETRTKASGAPRRSDETVDQMQPNLPYGE